MAMRISANFHSKCLECDEEWEKGEKIYWDPDTKNKKGKSPTCITYHCYQAQGGEDINEEQASGKEDLTFVLPLATQGYDISLQPLEKVLDVLIVRSHHKTAELYPNLNQKSNTFGMIRNAFIDHYVKLYTHRSHGS